MGVLNGEWRASAAYLYVLTLDRISLAWEYLRRNPDYIRDWQGLGEGTAAARWGLKALEDPALDARNGQPMWQASPEEQPRLVPFVDDPSSLGFSLWTVPGKKMLCHDGLRLLLTVESRGTHLHIAIDLAIGGGERFGYGLSSGLPLPQQLSRVQCAVRVLSGDRVAGPVHAVRRDSLVHMQTLQTLDASHAAASQRDAASTLFGAEEVTCRWNQDSELRARIRHYLQRGRALMRGGYLHLLYPSAQINRAI